MGRRKYDITPGTIYTGKKRHRRVIHTFEHATLGTRVIYSVGGDHNRECGYLQFRRWATGTEAKRASPERTPKMKLTETRA